MFGHQLAALSHAVSLIYQQAEQKYISVSSLLVNQSNSPQINVKTQVPPRR